MSMFTAEDVMSRLPEGFGGIAVKTVDVTGSTNLDVKALAEGGAPEGTTVIAGEQTAGRGRLGRSFYSPKDTGLYMSILLRPGVDAADALSVTTAAAVAVCEAVEYCCGAEAGIKWVNDVYIAGKKVCGILTESSLSRDGKMRYAVLGIGINVADGGFPADIAGKAGAIGADIALRPAIAAKTIECFFAYYRLLPSKAYMAEYRRRSILTGKTVEYETGGVTHTAKVIGIDDDARLEVLDKNGRKLLLSSGEVQIKKGSI